MDSLAERLARLDEGWGGRLLHGAGIAILFGLLAWEGITLSVGSGRVAAIWLPNAVLVAFALAFRRPLSSLLLPGFIGNVVADIGVGDALLRSVLLSLVNSIEIAVAVVVARRFVRSAGTITNPQQLFGYVGASIVAAGLSGFLAAMTLRAGGAPGLWPVWREWAMADGLALITVVPPLLILFQALERRKPVSLRGLADWGLCLGGSAVVFDYIFVLSKVPLLFVAVPVVMLCAFRLGAPGAAASLLLSGVFAAIGAISRQGPTAALHVDVHIQTQLQQLFLFATFLSTLPVVLTLEHSRALRARLNTILNSMNEIAFALDTHGRWTFLNDRWQAVFGLDPAFCLGKRALTLIPPAERREFLRQLRAALTKGDGEFRYAFVANLHSARPLHLEASLRPMDPEGEGRGLVGIVRDRTAEIESEQARRTSEQRMEAIAELAPVGIFRCDRSGAVTFLNAAWSTITGLPIEQGMGTGWMAAVHPEARATIGNAWNRAVATGQRVEGDFRYLRPNGEAIWVRGIIQGLRDAGGALTGFVGVVIDTSKERAALQESRRALAVAAESMKAKERFLANISHELRTPMNGIIGFADRLLAEPLTAGQRHHAALIAESGAIMLGMLNDILDMSRLAAGPVALAEEGFVLGEALADVCGFIEPQALTRRLRFLRSIDPALQVEVLGDAARLGQVLRNLLSNAVKFTHRGTVSLTAWREVRPGGPRAIIEVSDTGIGIAPAEQAIIFEEFAQANSGIAMRYGGTGLGLAISRSLVEAMGGSLGLADSDVGRGSRFRLELPLRLAHEAADDVAVEGVVDLAGLHVLVADDNPINQELLKDILRELGCRVVIVSDGDQAVRAAVSAATGRDPFAMVLMDLRMPKMDGLEATRLIRGQCPAARLPILAISANSSKKDRQACEEAGMQGHIAKPFTLASIARSMRAWRRPMPGEDAAHATAPGDEGEGGEAGVAGAAAAETARPSGRISPRLQRLKPRFDEQCRRCRQALTAAMAVWPEAEEEALRAMQTMAHNIAGTAALFDAHAVGERARDLDEALEEDDRTAVAGRIIALAAALEALETPAPVEAAPVGTAAKRA